MRQFEPPQLHERVIPNQAQRSEGSAVTFQNALACSLQFESQTQSTATVTMAHSGFGSLLFCAWALSLHGAAVHAQAPSLQDRCEKTAAMQIYSNAFSHDETGDLLGDELAVQTHPDSTANALLFIYEGGNAGDGIPLSGQVTQDRLTLKGTWAEHVIEHPSNRTIVEKHSVEIVGTIKGASFRGTVTIDGMQDHQKLRLTRVKKIWGCDARP